LFEKDSSIPEAKKEESKITAQIILLEILEGIMRLLHPIMPFITEEIWQRIKNNWSESKKFDDRISSLNAESIMIAPWTKTIRIGDYTKEAEEIRFIMNVVYAIRNIRGEMDISPSEKVDVFLETQDKDKFEMLKRNQFYIKDLIQINNIEMLSKAKKYPEPNSIGIQDEVKIIIPMPKELIEKEKTRLEKELKRLMTEEERLTGKLSNEGFLSKAPEEVVNKEKEKLENIKKELMIIKSKLEKMK
jgi:valyl-tRNA synthetase